ncbi:MAG: transporter substrate-binding domain-containing protein [Candidatus Hydrogenedens sp.]|nr:transporter substrate-binding domain-containing protein [Candidatus Hydrogenedens sp.]
MNRILLLAVTLAALFVLCPARPAAAEEPLILSMGNDTRPFYYVNDAGEPTGWMVELWRLWSDKTGTPIEFRPGSFAESLAFVRDGQADAHVGCFFSDERDVYLDYGVPVCEVSTHFFFDNTMNGLRTLSDLRGIVVGIIDGDRALDFARQKAPDLHLQIFPDNVSLFDAVQAGKIKAFVKDTAVGVHFLKERGILHRFDFPVTAPLYTSPFHVAVHDGNQALLDKLDAGMALITPAERAELELKWTGASGAATEEVLRVALVKGLPPYSDFGPDGRPVGLYVDLAQRLAREMERRVEFYPGSDAEIASSLTAGETDVAFALPQTEQNSSEFALTDPVAAYRFFPFFSNAAGMARELDALDDNAQVGVLRDSLAAQLLSERFPRLRIALYDEREPMVLACAQGTVAAIVGEGASLSDTIRRMGVPGAIARASMPLSDIPVAIGMKRDNESMVEDVNAAYLRIPIHEWSELGRRWITDPGLRGLPDGEMAGGAEAEQEWLNAHYQARYFEAVQQTDTNGRAYLSREEREWIAAHPGVTIGIADAWPPLNFVLPDGSPSGVGAELLKLIVQRTGLDIRIQPGHIDDNHMAVRDKRLDALMDITPKPEREAYLNFTKPYLLVPLVIVGRIDGPFFGGEDALAGKTVAIEKGYYTSTYLNREYPEVMVKEYPDTASALRAVSAGEVDAHAGNRAVAAYLMSENGLSNLEIMGKLNLPGAFLAIGVRKDWPELHSILDKALATVSEEDLKPLLQQWTGPPEIANPYIKLSAEERHYLHAQTPLVFSEVDWKPMSIVDDPERFQGIIADYFNLITERSGLKFQFKPNASWADVLEDYKAGAIEVVPAISNEDSVGRPILLSDSFVSFPLVIVAQDDVSYIHETSELNGKRVAVGRGYTSSHFLRDNYPAIELIETDDVETGLIYVSEGQADAFVGHLAVAVDHLRRLGLTNLKIAGQTEFRFEHRIGVDPQYPEALSIINKVLTSLNEEDHRAISKKWLDVQLEPRLDYTLIWRTVGIALLIIAAIALWNRKLALLNTKLSMEVREREEAQAAMHAAQHEAEAANRAKSDFLATMSHEIRTPMNAILGMAHLALRTQLNPKQRNYVTKIETSAKALLGIINDILDFSKIESGRLDMEHEAFVLEEVLDHLASLLSVRAKEREKLEILFDVAPDVPPHLIGDSLRLGQVLTNLGGNAIKFTDQGEIVVRVRLLESVDGHVRLRFEVRDSGIGLTPEQRGRLFQPFSQADSSTTRKFGGTGLGLSISKRLVEMMQGEIGVESVPGKGSTFWFTASFEIGGAPERPEWAGDISKLRVLVVDDSESSREILAAMLESFGIETRMAISGEEAIALFADADRERPFDLVLMDWRLPGMSGIQAAQSIRTYATTGSMPTIMLVTSYGHDEVLHAAENAGLDAVLLKPVSPSVLFDTIAVAFGKAGIRPTASLPYAASGSSLSGVRVLLVEDNEINQQVAEELLQGAGAVVQIAGNGREALTAVDPARHDVVLMDLQMPVMDGIEATQLLRKRYDAATLPIIAMTANAMAGDRERCIEAGMCDHIAKPIDPDKLYETILRWVKPRPAGAPAPSGPQSTTTEAELVIEGLNTTVALRRLGGNQRLYEKLLGDFHTRYGAATDELQRLLEAGNDEEAARYAHTIKGVAANLGADALAQAAGQIEQSIKHDREAMKTQVDDFAAALEVVMNALDARQSLESVSTGTTEPPSSVDYAAIRATVAKLGEILDTDIAGALELAEALKRITAGAPGKLPNRAGQVLECLEVFDTDGATSALNELSALLDEAASEG